MCSYNTGIMTCLSDLWDGIYIIVTFCVHINVIVIYCCSGSVDGNNQLIIKGKFQQKQIETVLRRYISKSRLYVL